VNIPCILVPLVMTKHPSLPLSKAQSLEKAEDGVADAALPLENLLAGGEGGLAPSSLSQSRRAGWRAKLPGPTKGKSIRSGVLRLVVSDVIAPFFPLIAEVDLR
jgi:hypothetical protein